MVSKDKVSEQLEKAIDTATPPISGFNHFNENDQKSLRPSIFPVQLSKFSKYSIGLIIFNLLVIAWGVYVRASKSGDGCGSHWPLCDGSSTPLYGSVSKLVEGAHRLSTSVDGLLVIGLVILGVRTFEKGTQVRKALWAVLFFTLVEGIIGGVLVKYKLVVNNESANRAAVMSFHVISTFMLVTSMTLCAYLGTFPKLKLKGQGVVAWMLILSAALVAFLGVSGSISALGHTLFPVKDVLKAAADPKTFWMVRLQPYHPYLAVAVGMFLLLTATLVSHLRPSVRVRRSAGILMGAYGFELILGYINIQTQAPIWLQMLHLASADALVVAMAWFGCEVLQPSLEAKELQAYGSELAVHPTGMSLVKEYVMLTKPRVISLLLVTTLLAMIAGNHGWPGFGLFLSVAIGGYLAAGAANTFNMVAERDLDLAMKRTSTRPTLTAHVSPSNALKFALSLTIISFALLWISANLLTAILAETGLVFYVSVYTLALKRRTWQNIVIGGAAGAIPPLVGWASVNGSLGLMAWCLFAIIFLWTPVHFWALAIMIKDDYAAAGVPMLPVVKGVRVTAQQICVYTLLTVLITFTPILVHHAGWEYGISAVFLNAYLIYLAGRLLQTPDNRKRASGLFHFSMLYLALLFVALAADQSIFNGRSSTSAPSASISSAQLTSKLGSNLVESSSIGRSLEQSADALSLSPEAQTSLRSNVALNPVLVNMLGRPYLEN